MTDSLSGLLHGEDAVEQADASQEDSGDVATWRARLQGKDKALTASQQARRSAEERLAAIESRAVELETALEQERQKAASYYEQVVRARYPRAIGALPEGSVLPDVAVLEAFESRMAALETAQAPTAEYEPRTDPNQPRRPYVPPPKATEEKDADELIADLRRMGTPEWSAK
jgi:hypothetical protein